jgi:hypothetical protein
VYVAFIFVAWFFVDVCGLKKDQKLKVSNHPSSLLLFSFGSTQLSLLLILCLQPELQQHRPSHLVLPI